MAEIKLDFSQPKITFSRGHKDGRDGEIRKKVPKVISLLLKCINLMFVRMQPNVKHVDQVRPACVHSLAKKHSSCEVCYQCKQCKEVFLR